MAELNGIPVVRASSKRAWQLLRRNKPFFLLVAGSGRYYVQRGGFATLDGVSGASVHASKLLDPGKKPR